MTISESEIKRAFQKNYGLAVKALVPLAGFYDKNYQVVVQGETFFLKMYGFDALPSIRFQLSLIQKCVKAGLPVAALVPTKDQKMYFKVGKYHGSLQKFLAGKQLRAVKKTETVMEEVGGVLGKIHALTRGKRFEGKDWKTYPWDLSQFSLMVKDYAKIKSRLPAELALLIEEVVADWKSQRSSLDKMRKGIVHNDYHAGNILMAKGTCTGVVDFGDSMRTWYAADVAIACAHICFKGVKNPEKYMQAFLKGYSRYFQLNRLELGYLALLMRMRAVCVVVGLMVRSKEDEPGLYQSLFVEQVEFLKRFSSLKNRS